MNLGQFLKYVHSMYLRANTKQHLEEKQAKESDYTKKDEFLSSHLHAVTRRHCSTEGPDSHWPTGDKTKVIFKAKKQNHDLPYTSDSNLLFIQEKLCGKSTYQPQIH